MSFDDPYNPENIALFTALYGENLISLGGLEAIENMFSGLDITKLKALDIGFGLGGIAFYLAEKYHMPISGVELQYWMVEYAQTHAPEPIRSLLKFAVYNEKGEIPFKADSFDLAYSKGVLNHVRDKTTLLRNINKLLKKDGLLVITDWIYPEPIADDAGPLVYETRQSYEKFLRDANFALSDFRNDSSIFMQYVNKLLINIVIQREFIEQKYGKDIYIAIHDDHRKLMENLHENRKFAVRIVATKANAEDFLSKPPASSTLIPG